MVCVTVWCVIILLITCYCLYLVLHNLRLRNNMCIFHIMYNISQVTQVEYVFQMVLVVLNISWLIVLGASSAVLFHILLKSHRSRQAMTSKRSSGGKMIRIGIMVLLLVTCNACCWIPVLTVSLLFFFGFQIHGSINIWIVILVIPISATTNPFLYNRHIFSCSSKK